MTDDELKAIEARQRTAHFSSERVQCIDMDLPALVAEVRRLRGLLKEVEHPRASTYWNVCAFCGEGEPDATEPRHRDDCRAFTPDGAVR